MRSIKISIIHTLQPFHPSVNDIDSDELNEAIHDAIDEYLNDLAHELEEADVTDDIEADSDDAE